MTQLDNDADVFSNMRERSPKGRRKGILFEKLNWLKGIRTYIICPYPLISVNRVLTICGTPDGDINVKERMEWIAQPDVARAAVPSIERETLKARFEEFKKNVILEWIPDRQKRARVTTTLVGIHVA